MVLRPRPRQTRDVTPPPISYSASGVTPRVAQAPLRIAGNPQSPLQPPDVQAPFLLAYTENSETMPSVGDACVENTFPKTTRKQPRLQGPM